MLPQFFLTVPASMAILICNYQETLPLKCHKRFAAKELLSWLKGDDTWLIRQSAAALPRIRSLHNAHRFQSLVPCIIGNTDKGLCDATLYGRLWYCEIGCS